MRGERVIQYAAALGIIALWGVLQILDARSETYTVPKEATVVVFLAAGFTFGFDKVAGFYTQIRRGQNGPPPPAAPPIDKESGTDDG